MLNTSDEVSNDINSQVTVTESAIKAFNNIFSSVNAVIPKIEQINGSILNIRKEKDDILEKIEGASAISQEISASAEEISASSEEMNASSQEVASTAMELSNMTKNMFKEIDKFKL
jgi:methyl-accepting chemotaxis protein